MSILVPPPEQAIVVTRGDRFEMVFGLMDRPEVVKNPAQYRFRLIFRRRQSDASPDLFVLNGDLELEPGDSVRGVDIDAMVTITATPDQTQQLPAAGCFYFVEQTNAVGGDNVRLFQGPVEIGD